MTEQSRVLDTFDRLLGINSPSGQEQALAEYLVRELQNLGLTTEVDKAGNVIALGAGEGEPLLLCAHMDTVESTEGLRVIRENGIIRSDGTTILGADDKAGIAAILEALRLARKRPPVEVVFTVREEIGLQGANALDLSSLKAKRGIVLDAGGAICTLVTGAPSQIKLTAKVIGKAAHAGVSPEKGINAIVVAAQAITHMPLGRIDDETTANIGFIHGGRATNIVPELVELRGEARSHSEEKLAAQMQAMRTALQSAAAEAGARVEIEEERSYTRFAVPDSHSLVATVLAVAQREGFEGTCIKSGGGSDANVFNRTGIQCFNLSVGMGSSHAKDEYIVADDLVKATHLLAAVLVALAG